MFSSGKRKNCVDDCVYKGYSTISGNSKDMVRVMQQLNEEGHLQRICKQKCRVLENSRPYLRCERNAKKECKYPNSDECKDLVKETCSNDIRVRMTKAVFY
ncbi:hypothetical protein B1750_gp278 [Noumeavirus]|uniref:Uncharacterized protein n=1 Tax=Marseillevirus sp. TaxID=2809551 RepID=A0AA96IZ55_9VIRU|nr:hypothetical protein B1750_gp278 [Noumeavirus]AQM73259.1 hypothetical protein NMV_278 [Noumeavirus]WNL50279.1 hypothetical protein MarDSR_240 [Marseillevirus sp.]